MIVTLDANVLASIVVAPADGVLARLLAHWRADTFKVSSSEQIFRELTRTLANPYFSSRLETADVLTYLDFVVNASVFIRPSGKMRGVASHPEDDVVLDTAVSAGATVLVSGDRMLLRVGRYQDIAILGPKQFLDLLATGSP